MHELNAEEIIMVSGGRTVSRRFDRVPNAQSEWGKVANDAFNALGELGSDIGVGLYDLFH
ncbi:hypothetical protein F2P45_19555 [Massilia sp. CCM 8733]|uniref:Uncharacterized protein n=1 Tax=Massilia mucilaginosa TaxID=2609282 RepID=A0ABX0NW60_9BURK|nr:hypothetical protein [Massilia mucilaginosa]NHZ91194.1 hypothetical protein [Massilia mucilaginosa]